MIAAMAERLEVQRAIAAAPAAIFGVLADPHGHVAIDSSGMLTDGCHGRSGHICGSSSWYTWTARRSMITRWACTTSPSGS